VIRSPGTVLLLAALAACAISGGCRLSAIAARLDRRLGAAVPEPRPGARSTYRAWRGVAVRHACRVGGDVGYLAGMLGSRVGRVGSPYSAVRSASGCPAGPSPLSGRPAPRPLDALREQILLPRDFEHPVPRRPADRGFGFVTKPFGLLAVSGRAALRAT